MRERLKRLLDDETFLELSPFAGLGLPYGDVPSAGCLTGETLGIGARWPPLQLLQPVNTPKLPSRVLIRGTLCIRIGHAPVRIGQDGSHV